MGRDASHDDDTAVLAMRARALLSPDLPGPDAASRGGRGDDGRVRVELQSTPEAAGFGRAVVTDVLLGAGMPELVDTGSLLVSELVTNALRHGGGPRELLVAVDGEGVDVGVRGASPRPPHPV